ncbi:hypothetical protein RLIN73S_06018 [Rhodanobacter lindaniclasticus]
MPGINDLSSHLGSHPLPKLPDSGLPMNVFDKNASVVIDDAQLLADEAKSGSFGDTVVGEAEDLPQLRRQLHVADAAGAPFLNLQMWYSAVDFSCLATSASTTC